MSLSRAERLARRHPDPAALRRALKRLKLGPLGALDHDWSFWARPEQLPPEGDWRHWLIMAGRGFGKTRAGAEWVRALAEAGGSLHIALVGASFREVRQVMVEGSSGLLAIAPPQFRPKYEASLHRLVWPGGATATLYSAAEPDMLRGPQHHAAWADEIGKWPNGLAVWDNLMMGLRLGDTPRTVATTTPRGTPLLRRLLKEPGVARGRGTSHENAAHLAESFFEANLEPYRGTRLGRQELDGELMEEVAGALWPRALIERQRVRDCPPVARVAVGVDPPAGAGPGGDACGIVAVALGRDMAAYVIEDATVSGLGPEGWARAVAQVVARTNADRVVAEANNGGAMVESVLRAAAIHMPVRLVHASHGKAARAEPVAALYERGCAWHVGAFPELEDQLAGLATAGGYDGPGRSPDRADALVWAMTELMLGRARGEPRVRTL